MLRFVVTMSSRTTARALSAIATMDKTPITLTDTHQQRCCFHCHIHPCIQPLPRRAQEKGCNVLEKGENDANNDDDDKDDGNDDNDDDDDDDDNNNNNDDDDDDLTKAKNGSIKFSIFLS